MKFGWSAFRDAFVYRRLAFAEPAESTSMARRALRIRRGDCVAGVTSSGDVLLSLLHDRPVSVRGFDANPTQTALARLKYKLRREMPLESAVGFLGLSPLASRVRRDRWRGLTGGPGADGALLDSRSIGCGLLNAGVSTRLVRKALRALRLLAGPRDYADLVSADSVRERRIEILRAIQHRPRYALGIRPVLRFGSSILQHFFFPPGLCGNSRYPRSAMRDILSSFARVFEVGFHDNPVFHRQITGNVPREQIDHLYSQSAWQTIKTSDSDITYETSFLADGLCALGRRSIDGFYLSNAPDYHKPAALRRLAEALEHAARPGARVYYLSLEIQCPFDRCGIYMPFPHLEGDEAELRESDPVGLYPYIGVRIRE